MIRFSRTILTPGAIFCAFLFLLCLARGCQGSSHEVPITTQSREARKLFLEGREQLEFLHTAEAYNLFNKAVLLDPEFALAYLYRAFSQATTEPFQNDLQQAFLLADKVSKAERQLIQAYNARICENDPVQCRRLLGQLAESFPRDTRVLWLASQTYRDPQETEEGIAWLEQALKIDDKFAPLHQALGYRYTRLNELAKAERAFKDFHRLAKDEPNTYDCLAELYTKMGRFEYAIEHHRKALELDPTFVSSQQKIGTNLVFLEKYEEGREAMRKAMKLEVRPSDKVYDMGGIVRSYIYERDLPRALKAADEVIGMAQAHGLPEEAARYALAKAAICFEMKDFDNAEACIAECRSCLESSGLVPFYSENYGNASIFWEALIEAARKQFDMAAAKASEYRSKLENGKDPDQLKYHTALLGMLALEQGNLNTACELLTEANVDEPFFHFHRARAFAKNGDRINAAKYFRRSANWNADGLWYAFVRNKAQCRQLE